MKFLVDETPIYKFDCPFCVEYCGKSGYFCEFDEGECDLDDEECECRWLKEFKDKTPEINPVIQRILSQPHEIKPYWSISDETIRSVSLTAEPPRAVVPTMPVKIDSDPTECNKLCKRSQDVCDYCKKSYVVSDEFYKAMRANSMDYVYGYLVKTKYGAVEGILTLRSGFSELAFIDESTLEEVRL